MDNLLAINWFDSKSAPRGSLGSLLNRKRLERAEQALADALAALRGKTRERVDPNQLLLFDIGELEEVTSEPEETPAARRRRRHGRRRLPADLPRQEIVHELAEHERLCPHDGQPMEVIGFETSEQLDYIPAKFLVLIHKRANYACRTKHDEAKVLTAPKPPQPIEKGLAGPGLLAAVAVGKGRKERLVPASPRLLDALRSYWRETRPRDYLFPGRTPDRPLSSATVQKACKLSAAKARIQKSVTPHTLRHTFATSMLEAGVDILTISKLLGHASFVTTMVYLHVRRQHFDRSPSPIDWLPARQCPQWAEPNTSDAPESSTCSGDSLPPS